MRYLACVVLPFFLSVLTACHGGGSSDSAQPTTTPPPANTAPVASFSSAATAPLNTPVVFDASASTSSSGGALQYVWDFGGGHRGGGKVIARPFTTAGTNTVTLTVIDSAGLSTTKVKALEVTAPAVAPATVGAQGVVKTADGSALQGVTVASVGVSNSATTDLQGKATLVVDVGVPLTLKLSKAGYADQFVSVQVPATVGSDAYFEATMRTRDAPLTLASAAAGGTLNGRDGARIVLPANSLVNGSGTPVSGAVSLTMTPVDPTGAGGGGFPGQFAGVKPDGSTTPIVSYGTTEFTVTAGGQALQLAPGKTATIEVPLYATLNIDGSPLTVGSTVPLWSLDEASGIWVQEGAGTVVASASSPTGFAMQAVVTHLSWWNADIGFDPYGPEPKCVYDDDIGLPEARDTFNTATVCNMLAEIDRTLGGNGNSGAPSVARAAVSAAPITNPRVAGYSRQVILPIAGGVPIPVPADVDIVLTASALNGTWRGTKVVNGPFNVTAVEEIKMRPLASTGPGTETVTLPFDDTRAMQSITDVDSFNFVGTAFKYARITTTSGTGSNLTGSMRLLQGNTVLATANFTNSPQPVVVVLPADATYTVQVAASGNAPGTYRLKIETLGALQSDSLTLPFDTGKAIAAFSTYRANFTINAPTTVNFAYKAASSSNASVRVVGPGGQLLTSSIVGGAITTKAIALPAAGAYFLEIAPSQGAAGTYYMAVEPTSWVEVAPSIPLTASSTLAMLGLVADHNGKAVVGYSRNYLTATPYNHNSVAYMLRRWTGTAWENVGTDLLDDFGCNIGTSSASLAFDSANNPIVAHGVMDSQAASWVQVSKFVGGVWQPIGPNNGKLPNTSAASTTCNDIPIVQVDSSDNVIVAYRAEDKVYVQKFNGTSWVDIVGGGAAVFASYYANFDLRIDSSDRVWFVLSEPTTPGQTVVRRLATLSTPAWVAVGANGGVLPEINTLGMAKPKLAFDDSGSPLLGAIASVNMGNGTSNSGSVVYHFNGTVWSTTGGYHPAGDNPHISNPQYGSFAAFENEGVMAWLESDTDIGNSPVVQINTTAGWSAFGTGIGRVPQFTPHGMVVGQGWQMLLLPIGSDLYMAMTAQEQGGGGSNPLAIFLLRKTAN